MLPKYLSARLRAFTLIELLIVVAIIAILAAIAVPNFLEAQTRSKVSRARADMRSLVTAHASYRVDYNKDPRPWTGNPSNSFASDWWGYSSTLLTTPLAYITSLPRDIFPDKLDTILNAAWVRINPTVHTTTNVPYVSIIRTASLDGSITNFMWLGSSNVSNWPDLDPDSRGRMQRANAVYCSAGPDTKMTWGYAQTQTTGEYAQTVYDPTNGTISHGDLFTYVD